MGKEIKIDIKVDSNIKQTTDDINKMNDGIENTTKATDDLKSSVKGGTDNMKDLSSSADQATGGMISKFKGVTDVLKKVALGFRTIGGAIAASGLGLLVLTISAIVSAFKSSEEGQNKFAKIMGVIGAVTGNLIDILSDLGMKIISVFQNPKKAIMDFANLIKTNIVNRFNGLLELIPALGKAVSKLFKGDFAGAAQVAGDAVAKVTLGVDKLSEKLKNAANATREFVKEQQREAKIASNIADQRAKADRLERDLITERAEANRKRAELLDKAQQKDKFNTQERIAFLQEASKLEEDITNKEIIASNLRRDAIIAENQLSNSTKEDKIAEQEAIAKSIELETARLSKQKEVTGQIVALKNEEKAANKATYDAKVKEADDAAKIAADALQREKDALLSIEERYKNELLDFKATTEEERLILEQERALAELEQLKLTLEEKENAKFQIEELYALKTAELVEQRRIEEKDAADKAREDEAAADEKAKADSLAREQTLANAKAGAVRNGLSLISNLAELFAGKSRKQQERAFKVQKAVNIANATIDTYKAATGAYASLSAIPVVGPALGGLAAAAAVAAGLVNVKKIASQKFDAGTPPTPSPAPAIPDVASAQQRSSEQLKPSFDLFGKKNEGGTAGGSESVSATQNITVKAVVVESDVTSTQNKISKIEDSATL